MALLEKIPKIQQFLQREGVDGWLLYDNHNSNRFLRELLEIPSDSVITRRLFYWIPRVGSPQKVVHRIEADALEEIPGETHLYLSWQELEQVLGDLVSSSKTVMMEYSPRNANPYISVVDGGTLDVIRGFGVEVVSSADLLQRFTSVLTPEQILSHIEAASVLQTTASRAWDLIGDRLRMGKKITEYEVQNFILSEFIAHNCITEDGPICAVNSHSALPHYRASKASNKEIATGDFILIDLWCKKDIPHAVYADITRVAVAGSEPTPRQQEIFQIVKEAGQKAFDFAQKNLEAGKATRGAEVDIVCRAHIEAAGFGEFFTHRTGHNIDTDVHGAGVHFDNLETADNRLILPGMCFSIEPGIYLPDDFGVRLEYNLLVNHDGTIEITGGSEETILCLL